MDVSFWILLGITLVCLADIVILVYVMCGSNAPTITEALCYIFYLIPLPSLFVGVLVHLIELGYIGWFIGHYLK